MKFLALIVMLFTVSCQTFEENADPHEIIRRDMQLSVDGFTHRGIAVLPRQNIYAIEGVANSKTKLIRVTSCHRDLTIEPSRSFQFTYEPMRGIEDTGLCPLTIAAFSANGYHSFAFLDFKGVETLRAISRCNGKAEDAVGVALCQSRTGLLQQVVFEVPVSMTFNDRCREPTTEDKLTWTYGITRESCVYSFRELKGDQLFRLVTLGYDNVILRSGNNSDEDQAKTDKPRGWRDRIRDRLSR